MIWGRQIHALLSFLFILSIPSISCAAPSFVIFDKGPKSPNDTLSYLYNISHDGRVVVGESVFRGSARHGLGGLAIRSSGNPPVWKVSQVPHLPTTEDPMSPVYDVAANNKVLSGFANATPGVDAAWFSPILGPLTQLPLFPGDLTNEGRGVNVDGNQVVGWGLTERKSRFDASVPFRHALLWIGGAAPVLIDPAGLAEGRETVAMATTNTGNAIAGFATSDVSLTHPFETTDSRGHQAVVWLRQKSGGFNRVFLPFLPTQQSCARAMDIDEEGRIAVGFSGTRGKSRPVLWIARPPGGFQVHDLGVLDGFEGGGANGVSPDGRTVVGSCYGGPDTDFRATAFIWDRKHGIRDIRKVLLDAGIVAVEPWILTDATAVSRNGEWVCGNARDENYNVFGWVARMP